MIAVQETSKAEEYFLRSDFEGIPDVSLVYCFSNMDEVFAALRKITWRLYAATRVH